MIELLIGIPLVLVLWTYIILRWERGVYGLLIYMPFAGGVALLSYPSILPLLFKDIFFIIPAYLSYFFRWPNGKVKGRIPKSIIALIVGLSFVVFIQIFNPSVINWMVALIGAKVWLFYLPIIFLAFSMLKSYGDLIKLCRLLVIIAWVPCLVGIAQWGLSMTIGYETTMQAFYGAAAAQATQEFALFEVGGTFFRIPSTFSFVTQYFGYTLAMIVPAYVLKEIELSTAWGKFANVSFAVIMLASFLSGARAAYLFVPLLLVLIYVIKGNGRSLIKMMFFMPTILLVALYTAGIDPIKMLDMMFELVTHYADEIVYQGLANAIQNSPLGLGTGMNTGAARFAVLDPNVLSGVENYYAKAVIELGILGLFPVVALFLSLIIYGYSIFRRLNDRRLRSAAAAILAFIVTIVLNSFKGWQIDLDPINVYFWFFAGILLKLKYIDTPYRVSTEKIKPNVNLVFSGNVTNVR